METMDKTKFCSWEAGTHSRWKSLLNVLSKNVGNLLKQEEKFETIGQQSIVEQAK